MEIKEKINELELMKLSLIEKLKDYASVLKKKDIASEAGLKSVTLVDYYLQGRAKNINGYVNIANACETLITAKKQELNQM